MMLKTRMKGSRVEESSSTSGYLLSGHLYRCSSCKRKAERVNCQGKQLSMTFIAFDIIGLRAAHALKRTVSSVDS